MTNWQKQVNSQLRLTPLFQPILVDYQSNFRYRVEEKGSTETHQDMAIMAPLGTQAAPPLISVFWQPHHCRYACDSCWEKPLETPADQAPHRPPTQTEVSLQRRSRHRLGMPGPGFWDNRRALCSQPPQAPDGIRAMKIFPYMTALRISHMWGAFPCHPFPQSQREAATHTTQLLSWHSHPLIALFFCVQTSVKLMLYSKKQS